MDSSRRRWTVFFPLAAALHLSVGGPILSASAWRDPVACILPPDAAALRLWGDVGAVSILTGLAFVWFLIQRPATDR